MKFILGWVIFSSALSLVIVMNAHKVIPVGEHTSKYYISAAELGILNQLLENESIDKKVIQTLKNEKTRPYKGNVIGAQIESIPISFIYFILLILNCLNIIFSIVWFSYVRNKHKQV